MIESSFLFFKQKTAYELRISDWSADVCSSDLRPIWRSCDGKRRRKAAATYGAAQRRGAALRAGHRRTHRGGHLRQGGGQGGGDGGRRGPRLDRRRLRAWGGERGRASGRGRVCQYG